MENRPAIGIVACGIEDGRQFVSVPYIRTVEASGGIPVIIPILGRTELTGFYSSLCQGYLFCGGIDISPLFFGEEPLPGLGETCSFADHFQIELIKRIISKRLPILAICRGMQVLNVALGGTVFQDLRFQPGRHLRHMQMTAKRSEPSHHVHVFSRSLLAEIVGETICTNSYHHQAVRRPGNGLTVSAQASDRTVEAVELTGHPFCIGVQWHPECMYDTDVSAKKLFDAFTGSAGK